MRTKIERFKAFSGHAFLMLPMLSLQQVNCLSFRFYCKGATIQFWSSKITSVSKGVGICARPLYFWQFYACLTSEVRLWWSKVNYFIRRLSFVCIYIQEWKEVSIAVLYGKQCTWTEIGVTEFCMHRATRKYKNGECVLISTQRLHSNLLLNF
jgi:hypothetical protein